MDHLKFRSILLYLFQPEDSCLNNCDFLMSMGTGAKKKYWLGVLKVIVWTMIGIALSLCIARLTAA